MIKQNEKDYYHTSELFWIYLENEKLCIQLIQYCNVYFFFFFPFCIFNLLTQIWLTLFKF